MAGVRQLSVGRPWRKLTKPDKRNVGQHVDISNLHVARSQTHWGEGRDGRRGRGRGRIGKVEVRMARVRHTEALRSARWRGQVLNVSVEIGAGIAYGEGNQ
jgi:hypothetical protein